MSDVVTVAIIGAIGGGIGSLLGAVTQSSLIQYRLEQLEKKVDKHNHFDDRIHALEKNQELLERHVEDLHRDDK